MGKSMLAAAKAAARHVLDCRPWVAGHAAYLLHQVSARGPIDITGAQDEPAMRAAARWLAAAQDSQSDGGFSGRYKLASGWSSSYPETTGYIIPTLLRLADLWNEPQWHDRAARAIDFLLGLQLPDGAFPGGEVQENRTAPSPFNSAQILHGLTHWVSATGDPRARAAAERCAAWLISMQDADGAFRRHFYLDVAATYSAYLSCWLAEYGATFGDSAALASAGRHLDWVLAQQDTVTGWFDLAGFTTEQHSDRTAYTHTIAYTIAGVLTTSRVLQRADGIAAARQAAEGIMRRLELSERLPGVLDWRWRAGEHPQCLTGNAQMALIWFDLTRHEGDWRFANAGLKALDLVKHAQLRHNPNPGLAGGIGGSDPVWGSYIPKALPNWAAKYFIDGLIEKYALLHSAAPPS
jgi:prenyltransferase beta subunit